jgi:hypothetical protein
MGRRILPVISAAFDPKRTSASRDGGLFRVAHKPDQGKPYTVIR